MKAQPDKAPSQAFNNRFSSALDQVCINTMRVLAMDAVQQANSGHPGLPMCAAPMAYVLWTRYLQHNPANPTWPDRDRFVLSAVLPWDMVDNSTSPCEQVLCWMIVIGPTRQATFSRSEALIEFF